MAFGGSSLARRGKSYPSYPHGLFASSLHGRARFRHGFGGEHARNGVFLNVAAAFAEALGVREVLTGYNREEAATFPDNSAAFLEAMNQAFSFSTLNGVRASSYTIAWDKPQILQEALRVNLPLNLVWSCYEAGPERCWKCESCKRSERALLAAGESGKTWLARMGWSK
jgi:7-cyano-7-deazaguanine synthase in queuosine biosynthesis